MAVSAPAQPPRAIPLAVVGLGALFPGSHEVTGFWRNILSGRDLTSEVPPTHWLIQDHYDPNPAAPDKTYGKRGAFLSAADFNPLVPGAGQAGCRRCPPAPGRTLARLRSSPSAARPRAWNERTHPRRELWTPLPACTKRQRS